ncbi:MAG: 3-oxoacid CoA-transferase subunit B [Coriobacteriales bacterium]|jgi:3-oxoacid CoA-transferase B subunit|nr:3-oxoacid CoA-transferase subunit B [Coriobacteriales bacterium]
MAVEKKYNIAKRAAKELRDGDVVNLGVGIPTLIPNYVSPAINVMFQGENGVLGLNGEPDGVLIDKDVFDAGGTFAALKPGASFFDSAYSFGIIHGGHIDITVLGALQVDSHGNLANWIVPDSMVVGYGGAMDLITCAKRVILAMEHTAKGSPKILEECSYPLTGIACVNTIITEMAVIEVTSEGLVLTEAAPGVTVEEIQKNTQAKLIVSNNLKIMDLS